MSKITHSLLLVTILIAASGCQTINGASCGFDQDVQNVSNPDANGWNALKKADAWMQANLW